MLNEHFYRSRYITNAEDSLAAEVMNVFHQTPQSAEAKSSKSCYSTLNHIYKKSILHVQVIINVHNFFPTHTHTIFIQLPNFFLCMHKFFFYSCKPLSHTSSFLNANFPIHAHKRWHEMISERHFTCSKDWRPLFATLIEYRQFLLFVILFSPLLIISE